MTITIETRDLAVVCDERGGGLSIVDRRRGARWMLDEKTLVWGSGTDLAQRQPLLPLSARTENHDTIAVTYRAGQRSLTVRYTAQRDHVSVGLPVPASDDVRFVALPGSFAPAGEPLKLLLPIMQGMLWDGRGKAFSAIRGEGSHTGFSMSFLGYLGRRGGLLVVPETRDDQRWWFGKQETGRFWASNLQIDSLGSMRYERAARLYPTGAGIVPAAKRYRQQVKESGHFVPWEAKIARRPALERLFGALMCFVGYCQDDLDYAAECRKLKAYGFDRALVYPVRFNVYHPDFLMGGRPPIDLSREAVAEIVELGYDVAPWSWLNEALDDGTARTQGMYRRNVQGDMMPHWAIDTQQWYHVCYSFLQAHQQRALRETIEDVTWDHFDVLACAPNIECYALDHLAHPGRPMTRGEDRAWVRKTFLADQARGLPVSSESFNDNYSLEYDLGSVKAWPQYGPWPFWPVPLTMLVYHDSMIHSWWEVHNYNNPYFGRTRIPEQFEYGGGRPKLMAALDALMGCPPDVFPFGAQYGWTGRGKETFLFKYRFGDPEVQLALREALPVAQLHRRIGKQEMVHFEILSEDGYVQETAFADGTRVVANFSRDIVGGTGGIGHTAIEGIDSLMPESWAIAE
ncbi:MAG: hypothetical protein ACYTEQ_16060 [Planctomycetota bacterium]|jgi:hypothetical protein